MGLFSPMSCRVSDSSTRRCAQQGGDEPGKDSRSLIGFLNRLTKKASPPWVLALRHSGTASRSLIDQPPPPPAGHQPGPGGDLPVSKPSDRGVAYVKPVELQNYPEYFTAKPAKIAKRLRLSSSRKSVRIELFREPVQELLRRRFGYKEFLCVLRVLCG